MSIGCIQPNEPTKFFFMVYLPNDKASRLIAETAHVNDEGLLTLWADLGTETVAAFCKGEWLSFLRCEAADMLTQTGAAFISSQAA